MTADHIHLNAARAGLTGGAHGKLADYEWSSLNMGRNRSVSRLIRQGNDNSQIKKL